MNISEAITPTAPLNHEESPPASIAAVMLQLILEASCMISAITTICNVLVRKLLNQLAADCSKPFPQARLDSATGATPISIKRLTNLPATSIRIVIEHTPDIIRYMRPNDDIASVKPTS